MLAAWPTSYVMVLMVELHESELLGPLPPVRWEELVLQAFILKGNPQQLGFALASSFQLCGGQVGLL